MAPGWNRARENTETALAVATEIATDPLEIGALYLQNYAQLGIDGPSHQEIIGALRSISSMSQYRPPPSTFLLNERVVDQFLLTRMLHRYSSVQN